MYSYDNMLHTTFSWIIALHILSYVLLLLIDYSIENLRQVFYISKTYNLTGRNSMDYFQRFR